MADISSITLPGGGTYDLKDKNSANAVASLNERYTNNTTWRMDTDANDYKTSGLYAMATGNANVPAPWGILFVQGAISDTIEQEYSYSGYIWHREYRSGSWGQWTLAVNQSQLGYIEIGSTASRNYTAGQFVCWKGLLYTADTEIASGATFYTSGGNKNLTECIGGGFNAVNHKIKSKQYTVTFSYNQLATPYSRLADLQYDSTITRNNIIKIEFTTMANFLVCYWTSKIVIYCGATNVTNETVTVYYFE